MLPEGLYFIVTRTNRGKIITKKMIK